MTDLPDLSRHPLRCRWRSHTPTCGYRTIPCARPLFAAPFPSLLPSPKAPSSPGSAAQIDVFNEKTIAVDSIRDIILFLLFFCYYGFIYLFIPFLFSALLKNRWTKTVFSMTTPCNRCRMNLIPLSITSNPARLIICLK